MNAFDVIHEQPTFQCMSSSPHNLQPRSFLSVGLFPAALEETTSAIDPTPYIKHRA